MKKIVFILPEAIGFNDISYYLSEDNFFLNKTIIHYRSFGDFRENHRNDEKFLIITDSVIPPIENTNMVKGLSLLIKWNLENKSSIILYGQLHGGLYGPFEEGYSINLQEDFVDFVNYLSDGATKKLIKSIKANY